MGQIIFDVREGVVIISTSDGQRKVFDRSVTGRAVINVSDSPDAETPDPEAWEPLRPATVQNKHPDTPAGAPELEYG